MNLAEFKQSLDSPQPVYLLLTDQEYLRVRVRRLCREQVEEGARAFNWSRFDLCRHGARDALDEEALRELLQAARTLPWMSARRWIYAENARFAEKELLPYLEDPSPGTTLVLELERKPRRWPQLPVIEMSGGGALEWILERVAERGYQIERGAAQALLELVGEDYARLESELEKQFLHQLESRRIELGPIQEMTLRVREHEVFDLIRAMARRDGKQALILLGRLLERGVPPPQILATLYWNFSRLRVACGLLRGGKSAPSVISQLKIWSYKGRAQELRSYSLRALEEVLIGLRDADRLSKTSGAEARFQLERLIIDTCSRGSL